MFGGRLAAALEPELRWPAALVVHPPAALDIEREARRAAAAKADLEFSPALLVNGHTVLTKGADPGRELASAEMLEERRGTLREERCVRTPAPALAPLGAADWVSKRCRHTAMLARGRVGVEAVI